MAVELATAYVALVPSFKGVAGNVQRELAGPTSAVAAQAGQKASQSFASKFAQGIGPGLSKAGGAMKAAGDKMSVGLSLPLAFLGNKVTNFASDLNESINATNVVFGESATIITQHAQTAAQSMGLSERAFREAVTPMGAMLQNLGLSQEEAATKSVALAGRASDMASVFNTDVSVALEAINAGLRGESDPLEQFGVGLNEAAVNAEAARLGLVGANGEVDAGAKAQARMSLIMGQTNKIAGDFANTSTQGANAQRIASAEAENAAAAFGQKLLPVKLKLINAATRLLNWFTGLSQGTQDLALKAGIAAAALGPLLSITGRLAKGIGSLVTEGTKFASWATNAEKGGGKVVRAFASTAAEAAKSTARVVKAIAVQVAQWVVMGVRALAAAAQVALAWIISLGPIALVIAAVAGAAALIILNWDKIKRFVIAAATAVVDFLKRYWPVILTVLTGPIGLAVVAIVKHWDKIKSAVSAAVTWVLNFVKQNWPLIIAALTGPLGIVVAIVVKNWDTIKGVFKAGITWVTNAWNTAWETVKRVISAAADAIVTTIVGWKDRVIGIFANALTWLLQAGRNILSGLFSGIKEVWNREVAFWTNLGSTFKGFVSNAKDWLFEGGKNILRGMKNGIGAIWKDVIDWFKDVPGKILDAIGIKSPPKWAVSAGRWVMKAFTKGLGLGVGTAISFLGGLVSKFSAPLRSAWDSAFEAISGVFGAGNDKAGATGFAGLAEPFASALQALFSAAHGQLYIISGRRSTARQAQLYYNYIHGIGGQARAAPPGRSKHEKGLAADLGGNKSLAHRLAPLFGLVFPVPGEDWHIEYRPGGHSYYERGAWRTGNEFARLHAGEMVLPAGIAAAVRSGVGAGAPGTYVAPGAVVIGIPAGSTMADAERLGGAAGRGFLEVLAQRRVVTDARIA